MSVLSCGQNALDEFPSARLSLARLCPHRAFFCLTVRRPLEQSEGKKRMIFRAYASKNPGVWGRPQGALRPQPQNNGNRKFTIFAILLLPNIKTVADPKMPSASNRICKSGKASPPTGPLDYLFKLKSSVASVSTVDDKGVLSEMRKLLGMLLTFL